MDPVSHRNRSRVQVLVVPDAKYSEELMAWVKLNEDDFRLELKVIIGQV